MTSLMHAGATICIFPNVYTKFRGILDLNNSLSGVQYVRFAKLVCAGVC